jgi:predicted flap endonuclease-1-like 5' DNA nuclease
MTKKLTEIEGIGATYSAKLEAAGVKSQEDLLKAGGTPKGRQELEQKTGIGGKLILKWVNRADLARVKGIGEEYSDLLELAGVDSVPELAQRNPTNLHEQLKKAAAESNSAVRRVPSGGEVEKWVAEAKGLSRLVSH